MQENIVLEFNRLYKSIPQIYRSPGRINLIGEHTDYNNGFVLPASVNKAIYFAISPNSLESYRLYAFDYKEEYQTTVKNVVKSDVHWANYLLGIIDQMKKAGRNIPGFDCVFGGNVPLGAGMSSSAAIECGLAYALNDIFQLDFTRLELVKISQMAEHEFAGVQCGIMDQFAVMYGKKDQVILLDCRSLDYDYFPFNMDNHLLILVNTGVKHSLASSEYNVRRNECNQGVKILQKYYSEIESLRDVSLAMLNEHQDKLPEKISRRCYYVIEENQRLKEACNKLSESDFNGFGKLMFETHEGLRDKYEVSCSELDHLVEISKNMEGVLGSRMMGGGFGGCTLNLIERDKLNEFKDSIISNYKTPEGKIPQIIEVQVENGTS